MTPSATRPGRPIGLKWRASYWFTTLVVGCGIAIDLVVYSIIIPVIPFQLGTLGYDNVSALAGWLLFAYSGGLLAASFPAAYISERYNERRWLLIGGFVILIASQIMFMEAPSYAVMCVARVIQGIGSAIVWDVGLALLADATPEQFVGQQLGFAMIGFTVGLSLGPPLGGALYARFGFRGPFIFGIAVSFLDLLGRCFIIERKDSLKWGFDPHIVERNAGSEPRVEPPSESGEAVEKSRGESEGVATNNGEEKANNPLPTTSQPEVLEETSTTPKHLPLIVVIAKLCREPRAIAASFIILLYGTIVAGQEPSIPVHLPNVWKLTSGQVGLVFIAAALPAFVSMPLSGYITDKKGSEWVAAAFLFLAIPWAVVLIIERKLALFVVAFGFMNFFTSGVMAPLTAELAAVARSIDGVGYAHVYAAYNLAYGIGSTIGPVIGGQMYDNLARGWLAICLLVAGLLALGVLVALMFVGERPVVTRILHRRSLEPAIQP